MNAHVYAPGAPMAPGDGSADDGASSRSAVRLLGCALAMLVVSFLVVTRSTSALLPSQTGAVTEFRSGTLVLADDDAGRTMFDLPALVPGQTASRCIEVVYRGDVDAVRVAMRADGGGSLAPALAMSVEAGTGGTFDDCAGFVGEQTLYADTLGAFVDRHSVSRAGVEAFTARPGSARSFRFTFTLDEHLAVQGATAEVDFLWSATPA
jgi:hypothetical protein